MQQAGPLPGVLPPPALAPPPALPPAVDSGDGWGAGLGEPLLLLIFANLEQQDIAAAHLVGRAWRDAARLSTRSLRFSGQPPDTERLKQVRAGLPITQLACMRLCRAAMTCAGNAWVSKKCACM